MKERLLKRARMGASQIAEESPLTSQAIGVLLRNQLYHRHRGSAGVKAFAPSAVISSR